VEGQRARSNVVFGHRVSDQLFGQVGGFTERDHPAHDIAAEDIKDDVQVIATPLAWTLELGDIPAPDFVGLQGQQFGLGIGRMDALVASLA
jgi:hypothetical protein